jgi:hypothetical protein
MDGVVVGLFRCRLLRRLAVLSLLACAFVCSAAMGSLAAIACKPILSIKNVREIRPSNMPIQSWIWTATIVTDSSHCATASGSFEIDFIRIKEYAPDVQFTEKYRWTRGQFDVTVELAADESIQDYRLGFIAPCVCRDVPFE